MTRVEEILDEIGELEMRLESDEPLTDEEVKAIEDEIEELRDYLPTAEYEDKYGKWGLYGVSQRDFL